jgi:hypothetical protein
VGPHRLSKTIQFIRCVFKYAYEAGLLDRPVRFGPGFKRPSKKVIRLHRTKQGPNLFTPEEVRELLDAASVQARAMILLGINCGFGNSDCGNLPQSVVDLDAGMINYPRPQEAPRPILPRRRSGEPYFDPIPLRWVERAAALPGRAWHLGCALWLEAIYGPDKSPVVKVSARTLQRLGLARRTNYRALASLRSAGLIRVETRPGQLARIMILDFPTEGQGREQGGGTEAMRGSANGVPSGERDMPAVRGRTGFRRLLRSM